MVESADSDADPAAESDSEWRFSVDDVGPEADTGADEDTAIEPETISLEHATFVVVGVVLTLGVVVTGL
jgi:hypothetical protein